MLQPTPMWQLAQPNDDSEIIQMCLELNREDPGPRPVPKIHTLNTLQKLRAEPLRGRAIKLEIDAQIAGYAFLISFWSNELGGEVCYIDEIYVKPSHRGNGYGGSLIQALTSQDPALWPKTAIALELEVTPSNSRARELYNRLGFRPVRNAHMRYYFTE